MGKSGTTALLRHTFHAHGHHSKDDEATNEIRGAFQRSVCIAVIVLTEAGVCRKWD